MSVSVGVEAAESDSIRLENLTYSYPDGRQALRGVTFRVARGESVALVGPNGAGKSTLLWHLNGLLPGRTNDRAYGHGHHGHGHEHSAQNPELGNPMVWIDGLEVKRSNFKEIRRRVGLLFQDPDDQLFEVSVWRDVAFGPKNLGKSSAEAKRIALECLERVNLADIADQPPHHLSFGERKRACLAGLLACDPTILALDEPTANLDPRARRRLIELIRGLDCAKLIATHDLELVLELCDRAILLDQGRLIANGVAQDLLAQEELLLAHGLEVPLSIKFAKNQVQSSPPTS